MIVYFQWARANPQGWEGVDVTKSQDVRGLPNKGEPSAPFDPGAADADDPGWLVGIMVQGVPIVGFDHIGPSMGADGRILVHAWNDDPTDFPPGERWGITWSFGNPRLDPAVGNRMNTDQLLTVYRENPTEHFHGWSTTGGNIDYRPWTDFDPPGPANLVRHGIWISSDCEDCGHPDDDHDRARTGDPCTFDGCTCAGYASLWRRHKDAMAATPHGWREWAG